MDTKVSTIKERVLYFIENQEIDRSYFLDKIDMSIHNFSKAKMSSTLKSDTISIILKLYPDLNPYWLLNGEGEMLKAKKRDSLEDYSLLEILNFIEDNQDEFLKVKEMQRFLNRMGLLKHYDEVANENKKLRQIILKSNKTASEDWF